MTTPQRRRLTPDRWWDIEAGRLAGRRRSAGKTAAALAALVGVDPRTLLGWEAGTARPDVVLWLEWRQALGMNTAPNLGCDNPLREVQ